MRQGEEGEQVVDPTGAVQAAKELLGLFN